MDKIVKEYLEKKKISYEFYTHPAVFTTQEAGRHCKHVPRKACKNLFLQDKEANKLFLVIIVAEKRLDIKALTKSLKTKHLSFGNPELLEKYLKLKPGSVSPFGLLNDEKKDVDIVIDKDIWDAEMVNFHPNVNTESLALKKDGFHAYIESLQQRKIILEL